MNGPIIDASERAFRDHVGRADFVIGAMKRRWRLVRIDWPAAYLTVTARDGLEWGFRFQLDGYPAQLPNARPCDTATGETLPPERWPQGSQRVASAFNPNWNRNALYLPCDRLALPGHQAWVSTHPELLWRPARGIVHYLEIIHELLSSGSYRAPVRPAA